MDSRRRRAQEPSSGPLRRSSTAPMPSSSSSSSAAAAAAELQHTDVEILYTHPSARIVTFNNHETTAKYVPETLVPSGSVDRTLAVGPLRIYKAPGSVTFLNCGSALKPILPKSQCWCIEEDSSRFVLQVRAPQFWRIEIPVDTAEYVQLAAGFRDVLDYVLLFDKTPCPFQRSFTVEIPHTPEVRKRPWKPVPKTVDSLTAKVGSTSLTPAKSLSAAKKARQTSASGSSTPSPLTRSRGLRTPGSASPGGSGNSTPPRPQVSRVGEVGRLTRAFEQQEEISNKLSGHRRQPSSAQRSDRRSSRTSSGAAPPLYLSTPDRSKSRASMYSDSGPTSPTTSTVGSDSLFSGAESWQYASPPFSPMMSPSMGAYQDDDEGLDYKELAEPGKSKSRSSSYYPPPVVPKHPGQPQPRPGSSAGSSSGSGHRRRSSIVNRSTGSTVPLRRPTLSSLPPPVNLLSGSASQRKESKDKSDKSKDKSSQNKSRDKDKDREKERSSRDKGKEKERSSSSRDKSSRDKEKEKDRSSRDKGSSRDKEKKEKESSKRQSGAFSGLMSTPNYLVGLMLKVSAQISAGESRGVAFGVNEDGERVPVQWDYTDRDYSDDDDGDGVD